MSTAERVLATLGYSPEVCRLYARVLAHDGTDLSSMAARFGVEPAQLRTDLQELRDTDLVRIEGDQVVARPPAETIGRWLEALARALPQLSGNDVVHSAEMGLEQHPLDGELVTQASLPDLVRVMLRRSEQELRWVRPTLWSSPLEDQLIPLVGEAVAQGRRCRGLYPLRMLREAPVVLAARAAAGEEVRLVAEVPVRMLLVDESQALLPEPEGRASEHDEVMRMLVRQPGLVGLASVLFELLWQQGRPLHDHGREDDNRLRGYLLEQLAGGAQDEQIARRLGVSLRTVRRRIAELMTDLGVDTRFQAGVEATRRGWFG